MLISTAFVSCNGNNNSHNGTYYPDYIEMTENLKNKGYTVICEDNNSEISGKFITASKKDEEDFIEFYWLDDSRQNDEIQTKLKDKYSNYDIIINIQDDEKLGNVVFCSNGKAIDDAGIIIVDVKVMD